MFQDRLRDCFADADVVVISQIARLHLLDESERLSPDQLIGELRESGKIAHYLPDVDAIVETAKRESDSGDVICVFSNGGFGGIHERLLTALA